jgi:hypothetical protein
MGKKSFFLVSIYSAGQEAKTRVEQLIEEAVQA